MDAGFVCTREQTVVTYECVTLACNPSPGEVEAEESGPFNTVHEFKANLDHIDVPWATL